MTTLQLERRAAEDLYGAKEDPDYPDRLLGWAAAQRWHLHSDQFRRICPVTLRRPRHTCSHCRWNSYLRHLDRALGWNLDHVVLLRRGTRQDPTEWALLSQLLPSIGFADDRVAHAAAAQRQASSSC